MDTIWLIVALVLALVAISGVALLRRRPDPAAALLQQQLEALSRQIGESAGSTKLLHDRLGQVTQEVNGQLGTITTQVNSQIGLILTQGNKQLATIGKQVQEATGQMGDRKSV